MAEAAQRVVETTNAFRKAQGLQAQSVNPALESAARDFARFMAKTGKYGHAADGRKPAERAAAHGYDYCIVLENIAYLYRSTGYDTVTLAQELVEGWKKSPEHRKNMLDPAVTQTGIGVAQGEAGRYFGVQMFGRPKSAAIRFSVKNRAGTKIDYRAGERKLSLPPRAVRTHTVCRPVSLAISLPSRTFSDLFLEASVRTYRLSVLSARWPATHYDAYRGGYAGLAKKGLIAKSADEQRFSITNAGIKAMV